MPPWRSDWVNRKVDIAGRLAQGEIGGGYGEGILVISAVINAMAAEIWPGKNIDRKRFVELLIRYSNTRLNMTKISIPLFVSHYNSCSRSADISPMVARLNCFPEAQVLTSDDVDLLDSDVIRQCPNMGKDEIRDFSYPCIYYREIRSGYTHEYSPTERADSRPMTRTGGVPVSYVNVIEPISLATHRRIYFHIDWLAEVTRGIAASIDSLGISLPLPIPSCWWVDEK